MPRFSGVVGYGVQQEIPPGSDIWKDVIVERKLRGEVLRNTKQNSQGENLNDDLTVSNSISVVADAYARANFDFIRYVFWNGKRWKVSDVDASTPPRLILRLGVVYNGPTPV